MEKEPPKLYEDSTSNKDASVESLLWEANGKVTLGKLKLDYIVKLKKEKVGTNNIENFLNSLGVALHERKELTLQEKEKLLKVILDLKENDATKEE